MLSLFAAIVRIPMPVAMAFCAVFYGLWFIGWLGEKSKKGKEGNDA